MALEVGIVGLPGSGKSTLFTALTRAGGGEYGKTNVAMAAVADARLGALAEVVHAKKVTPAAIRVQDVPAPARRCSAISVRSMPCSSCSTGSLPGRIPLGISRT